MRTALEAAMQATLLLDEPAMNSGKIIRDTEGAPAENCADEIYSYLAARDLLLRNAESTPNESTVRRALAANEYAESCLRPAASPYQAQSLPAAEGARERLRCHAVKVRLGQLRARAGQRRAA